MPSPYQHSTLSDEYTYVELGPIRGLPEWHLKREESSYPFPTEHAAERFAVTHAQCHHAYEWVRVRYPDGTTRRFK